MGRRRGRRKEALSFLPTCQAQQLQCDLLEILHFASDFREDILKFLLKEYKAKKTPKKCENCYKRRPLGHENNNIVDQ